MQGTVKYAGAMSVVHKGNSKTIQAHHSDGACKVAGKTLLQMCHGKLYPYHPSWPPTAMEALLLLHPRGGWVASKAKKVGRWGAKKDARMGQVLLSCRSLGCLHTDKLRAESGGWTLKCADCESWAGGSLSDYYIILGWTLWAGQLFRRGSCGNAASITYL